MVNIKRLKKLQDIMENHDTYFKKIKFSIDSWTNRFDAFMEKAPVKKGHICTSAACALGSAASYAPFRKAGLITAMKGVRFKRKGKAAQWGYDAGAAFFGITLNESAFLFQPSEYRKHEASVADNLADKYYAGDYDDNIRKVTAKLVAKRVGLLIKHYEKHPGYSLFY